MAKTPEELLLDRLVCIRQTVNVMTEKLAYLRESKEFCCNFLSSSSSSSSSSGLGNIWLPIASEMEVWGIYQPSLGVVLDDNDGVQQITDLSGNGNHLVDSDAVEARRALYSNGSVISNFATNRSFAGKNVNMPLSEYLIIAVVEILTIPSNNSNRVLGTYRASEVTNNAHTSISMVHDTDDDPLNAFWGTTFASSGISTTDLTAEIETHLLAIKLETTTPGTYHSMEANFQPLFSSPTSQPMNVVQFGSNNNKQFNNSNVGVKAFIIFDNVDQFNDPAINLQLQALKQAMYQQFCS